MTGEADVAGSAAGGWGFSPGKPTWRNVGITGVGDFEAGTGGAPIDGLDG